MLALNPYPSSAVGRILGPMFQCTAPQCGFLWASRDRIQSGRGARMSEQEFDAGSSKDCIQALAGLYGKRSADL